MSEQMLQLKLHPAVDGYSSISAACASYWILKSGCHRRHYSLKYAFCWLTVGILLVHNYTKFKYSYFQAFFFQCNHDIFPTCVFESKEHVKQFFLQQPIWELNLGPRDTRRTHHRQTKVCPTGQKTSESISAFWTITKFLECILY